MAQARAWGFAVPWSSPALAAALALALGLALGAFAVLGSPLLALVALIGAATGLTPLRHPIVGLHALIALSLLLPFAVIPIRLGAQLTVLEAVLGLTLSATLLRALARRERLRPDTPTYLLLGVLALAGLSFILSLPYTGSLAEVGRSFGRLGLAMLALPLTVRLVRDQRRVGGALVTVMLCGAFEGASAIVLQWLPRDTTVRLLSALGPLGYPTGPGVLRFLPGENDTYTDIARATGTSIDPNVLGGELMLIAALLLSQLAAPRPRLTRWLLLPFGAMSVLGMLLSQSRSSWVGLAVALLALGTLRYRRLWLMLLPTAFAVGMVPAGRALYGRVLSGFAGQDKAAGMRLDEYRNALEIARQHPLFGIGFGQPPTIDLAPGVSSIYLTVAETMGLPALVLYLAVLALLVVGGTRALFARLEPGRQGDLASLLTVVSSALIAGLFDHYFASTVFPHMVALFWLFCGLLYRASTGNSPT